jgi:Protein of unknown function (DUF2924)
MINENWYKALRTTGRIGPAPSLSLKPGARLVRDWGGRTHAVTVTEDDYPSLAKIAKKITGAHWLGPRFSGWERGAQGARATESAMGEPEKTQRRPAKKARCAIYSPAARICYDHCLSVHKGPVRSVSTSHGPACLPEGLLEAVLGLIQTLNFLGVFKDLAAFAL